MAKRKGAFPKTYYLMWDEEGNGEWYLSPVASADDAARGEKNTVEVAVYELKHVVQVTRKTVIKVKRQGK